MSTPHTVTNAHRPWACRGMPFDDVCQIPSSDARAPLGGRVFFFTRRWRLRGFGEGPVPSLYRNLPHTRSVRFNRDLKN